ncbi:MAG: hypothetical protein HY423_00775 [Candidatus Lambdaproteobacteria bacterium]|nr:hypothetical protein [Candidatus Lambdaproteobacteria bacterium]
MLAAESYTRSNPLKVKVSTRSDASCLQPATWALDELRNVGIDVTLETVDSGNWFAKIARRDFQLDN